jgi:hypothetical protein
MYRDFVAAQGAGAPPPAPKPAENEQTYTLTTSASTPNGGHITRNPDKETYAAGEKVGVTAVAAQPPKPAAAALSDAPKKKSFFGAGLAMDIAGAGLLMYGIIRESSGKKYVNDGYYANRAEHEDAKKAASSRNAGYAIGSALLLTGISFHVFF